MPTPPPPPPSDHRPVLAGVGEPTIKPKQRRKPRAVSHLEPERLQRKRQVDRKAQAALRDRARSRVQTLEAEVELLSKTAEQRERHHVAQVTALQEQNTRLRERLDSIAHLILHGENDMARATRPTPQSPSCHDDHNLLRTPGEGSVGDAPGHSGMQGGSATGNNDDVTAGCPSGDHSMASNGTDPPIFSECPSDQVSGSHSDDFRRGDVPHSPEAPISADGQSYSVSPSELGAPDQSQGLMDGGGTSDAIQRMRNLDSDASTSAKNAPSPAFCQGPAAISCTHLQSTCILDTILVNFYSGQRKLLQEGASLLTVLGPSRPYVATIVHPGSQSNHHPICRIIEDVMSTFGQIQAPEKLGIVFKMHATLRWLINNTVENYEYMPRWLRPTATQITTPHAAWIDNIPWPAVRDMLIENPILYRFEVFSEVYSHTVSVNWPYDTDDALATDECTGHLVIAPIFEKHVRRLGNWTVSKEFEDYFPDLAKATKVGS
ncbi:uncharacterized protein LTR77_006757 [Saxophila tyrrhenica]|uniref:BZIP transcription factor n=1 Tax=Saxophila tyrrhenica TaxID=1690608 RepID=A0AAV9P6F5_9PEZI|nr:hypothetical protein LTR77_006757 [Saxophila tyrrhenica]